MLSHRKGYTPRSRLKRVGKKTKAWRKEWRKIKVALERQEITRCERCGSDYFLTPAHSRKRNKIETREQLREVALPCVECHRTFDEDMTHEEMEAGIKAIIAARETT